MDDKKRAAKEKERDVLRVQIARYQQVINDQTRKLGDAQAKFDALEKELNEKSAVAP